MTTCRLTDSARALQAPQPVESDRAEGCGVMGGALLGGVIWVALLAIWLAF